jgi:hypothetical protein
MGDFAEALSRTASAAAAASEAGTARVSPFFAFYRRGSLPPLSRGHFKNCKTDAAERSPNLVLVLEASMTRLMAIRDCEVLDFGRAATAMSATNFW